MQIGRHRFEVPPDEIEAILKQALEEDRRAEADLRKASNRGCTGCFLIFVGLAVLPAAYKAAGLTVPALATMLVVGLPLIAWGIVLMRKGDRLQQAAAPHDLDNAKLDMVQRLVAVLKTDLPPRVPLTLEVDFRSPYDDEFKRGQAQRQTWLTLSGRFVDRTAWRLSLTRSARMKTKPKKKGRTKSKERLADTLSLQVRVAPGRFPDLQGLPAVLGAPPRGLRLARCQAGPDRVQVGLATPPATTVSYRGVQKTGHEFLVDADSVLASLVWLFRGLKRLGPPSASG